MIEMLPRVRADSGEFLLKHGLRLRAYQEGHDYVSKQAYWFGDFDPWVDRTLARLAGPGDIAIDIGANIGTTTLCLARAVGPTGRVFSFEPLPSNFEMLRANLKANGFQHVEAWRVALSDRRGVGRMVEVEGQAGQARMGEVVAGAPNEHSWLGHSGMTAVEVITSTFDAWAADQQLRSVSVCKIDVEGFEESVLRGMHDSLQKRILQAFVVERHVAWQTVHDPIFDLLDANGYSIYRIDKGLRAVNYARLGSRPSGQPSHDFLAVVSESEAARRIAPWIQHRS
jgi:FkbM family methyltransferase